MAATYTPSADHGLSAAGQALEALRLESEVLVAEEVLGLAGAALTGDEASKATVAVARQVNLQLKMAGASDVVAESKGSQSFTYARVNGQRVAVDSLAQAIVSGILGSQPRSGITQLQPGW